MPRYPRELSGGQQQRVAVARALAIDPQVLLMDEPLSGLDASLRERVQYELRALQQASGTTTIYVTHDQHEAFALSDRIAVMNQGRIEQIGPVSEVHNRPTRHSPPDSSVRTIASVRAWWGWTPAGPAWSRRPMPS